MRKLMLLPLTLALFLVYGDIAEAQEFAPAYSGELVINEASSLPLKLNLDGDKATLDSPAQGAFGIPIDDIEISNQQLAFRSNVIQASFKGKRTENGCYEGRFTQGMSLDLTLCPLSAAEQKTPQQELAELPVDAAIIEYRQGDWQVERLTFNIDSDQRFEIGSVTKTMVSWLLAQAMQDGVVSENTRLNAFWPNANEMVGNIKLVDIATHHSGLPRLPKNLKPGNMNDPYIDYDVTDLEQAVSQSSIKLPAQYEYSNFGYGLLAETLAKAYQQPIEALFRDKLFTPLAMNNSYLALEPIDNPQLIAGSRIDGSTVPHWHFDALAGAGAVISTVDDMVAYLQTLMQPAEDRQSLVDSLLTPRHSLSENSQQALGWLKETHGDQTLVWHNGQTAGFASFVGFTEDGTRGVVILSSRARSVTEIGKQLLLSNP